MTEPALTMRVYDRAAVVPADSGPSWDHVADLREAATRARGRTPVLRARLNRLAQERASVTGVAGEALDAECARLSEQLRRLPEQAALAARRHVEALRDWALETGGAAEAAQRCAAHDLAVLEAADAPAAAVAAVRALLHDAETRLMEVHARVDLTFGGRCCGHEVPDVLIEEHVACVAEEVARA